MSVQVVRDHAPVCSPKALLCSDPRECVRQLRVPALLFHTYSKTRTQRQTIRARAHARNSQCMSIRGSLYRTCTVYTNMLHRTWHSAMNGMHRSTKAKAVALTLDPAYYKIDRRSSCNKNVSVPIHTPLRLQKVSHFGIGVRVATQGKAKQRTYMAACPRLRTPPTSPHVEVCKIPPVPKVLREALPSGCPSDLSGH